jgi:hypothetical protein
VTTFHSKDILSNWCERYGIQCRQIAVLPNEQELISPSQYYGTYSKAGVPAL